jgi:hypothetical protein
MLNVDLLALKGAELCMHKKTIQGRPFPRLP